MAKIKVYLDPRNENYFEYDVREDKSLREFILEKDLSHYDFHCSINGHAPEEINPYLLVKNHQIILRRIFEGSGSDGDENKGLATAISIITSIVAVAVSFVNPAIGAAIALGGGLLSGAVRYLGMSTVNPNSPTVTDSESQNVPEFSLNSASNEARALQPMPLILGSHRIAPDYHTQPVPGYHGGKFETEQDYVDGFFIPTGDPNTWDTFPALSIMSPNSTPWPLFDLKIMPEIGLTQFNALTATAKRSFAPTYTNVLTSDIVSSPVIVYHSDPADPNYERFSTLNLHYIITDFCTGGRGLVDLINAYNVFFTYTFAGGTLPAIADDVAIWLRNVGAGQAARRWTLGTPDYIFHNTSVYNLIIAALANFLNNSINEGERNSTPKSTIFRTEADIQKIIEAPVRSMKHIFNYGFGDLEITNQRVEKVENSQIVALENSIVDPLTWEIPDTPNAEYINNVRVLSGATLVNNETFPGPATLVGLADFNIYNFVSKETPKNTYRLEIDIEARLYTTGSSGLEENVNFIEIQYKRKSDTQWTFWPNPEDLYFKNDTTLPIRRTFGIDVPSDEYEVRVRKMTPDEDNNTGQSVAQFEIAFFKFFVDDSSDKIGMNLEGLYLVANSQTSGQTNKYSALVENKVFVWNGTEWVWEHSRNPAWQFLYYVRGGFRNDHKTIFDTWPDSPTIGWTNNAENERNIERIFGAGIPNEEINLENIILWAQFCTDKNLSCDLVINDSVSCQEALARIADTGRASVTYYKGLLDVIWESEDQVPVAMFGMGNILKDSFQVSYLNKNVPSKLIGNFTNRDDEWESDQVECIIPGSLPEDLNFAEVNLIGITDPERAQREINLLAARQAFTRRQFTWVSGVEGSIFRRGDLVYLSHDLAQYDYSGRLTNYTVIDENLDEIHFQCKVGPVEIVYLRLLDGQILEVEGELISGNVFKVTTVIPASDLPEDPKDLIFMAGEHETIGRLVRISEVNYQDDDRYQITSLQEEKAIYAFEYDQTTLPDDNVPVPTAKITNYDIDVTGNIVKIKLERKNAHGVRFEQNGIPLIGYNGSYSFYDEAVFNLPSGNQIIRMIPFQIGGPYNVEFIDLVIEVP